MPPFSKVLSLKNKESTPSPEEAREDAGGAAADRGLLKSKMGGGLLGKLNANGSTPSPEEAEGEANRATAAEGLLKSKMGGGLLGKLKAG